MKKIKTITNISTVGELKKLLRGLPDDIAISTTDGDSYYYEPISMNYIPHLRTFLIDVECSSSHMKNNCVEVDIA